MSLNLRQTLRRWTTSTGISGPIHRNTQRGTEQMIQESAVKLRNLARLGKVLSAPITQVMNLLHLAPGGCRF